MNTFWSPVGAQGASVYWRRRFAAFLFVLIVVALLTYAVTTFARTLSAREPLGTSKNIEWSEPAGDTAVAADMPDGQSIAQGDDSRDVAGAPSGSGDVHYRNDQETAARSGNVVPDDVCQSGMVTVKATTAKKTFVSGAPAEIGLVITNVGRQACRIDAGTKALELLVMDGDRTVWSSDHCQINASSSIMTLYPKQSTTSKVQWSMNSSNQGCSKQPKRVPPGSYSLMARVGELYSNPKSFAIQAGK